MKKSNWFCFGWTVFVISGKQLLQDGGGGEGNLRVQPSIGQQNSLERALVQAKGSRLPAAQPHPKISKVPLTPPGLVSTVTLLPQLPCYLCYLVITVSFSSSDTQGQIMGARESLNGRGKNGAKKSNERGEETLWTMVVYHLHGQTGRFTVWLNGSQRSRLVTFIPESRLPFIKPVPGSLIVQWGRIKTSRAKIRRARLGKGGGGGGKKLEPCLSPTAARFSHFFLHLLTERLFTTILGAWNRL